jgi:hypothetical protein
MPEEALALARQTDLDAQAIGRLRELGESLNYNAYGESETDVLVPPDKLYRILARYDDPFRLANEEPVIERLLRERTQDLELALGVPPLRATAETATYLLPDAPWSRRVSGTFANQLARQHLRRAFAVFAPRRGDGYVVSVRVPAGAQIGAHEFCSAFPGGGGRREAAGIDRLPAEDLALFVRRFGDAFG